LDKSHICYVMCQVLSSHDWYFVAEKYSPRKRTTDLTAFAALDLLTRLKRIIVYSSNFFRTSSTLLNTAINCQKYISEIARARIWDTYLVLGSMVQEVSRQGSQRDIQRYMSGTRIH
jgi:hypothetical protein